MAMKRSFTLTELAERWSCSRASLYRMMQRGELPYFYVGRTRRVSIAYVEALESGEIEPERPVAVRPSADR